MTARTAGRSGAECTFTNTVAIHATWNEDIYFFRRSDGAPMDISGLDFEIQFRRCASSTSADVTLSTTAGQLTIETDDGSVDSILRIASAAGAFVNYPGDIVTDIVAIDGDENVMLYGHGIVTFTNNPVAV